MDNAQHPPVILFVDDEHNILSSLRRVFHDEGYGIRLASSGPAGLLVLEKEPVDLVVSDMRMPEMSGAQFLAQVAARWPEVPRILLTGYSDLDSTIDAVNRGRIFQYVAKPWNEAELKLAVRNALDSRRLKSLVERQNEELKALNADLERKVAERTAELEQASRMYALAYEQMRRSYLAAVPVFVHLVEMHEGERRGLSRRVADHARAIAQRLKLDEETVEQITQAALLHEIGKIGLPERLIRTPYGNLTPEERASFERYPARGEAAITALEPLAPAAALIRHHRERWDGSGYPDRLEGEAIPLGARILLAATEYEELQTDALLPEPRDAARAREYLKLNAGHRYDPRVVEAFLGLLTRPGAQTDAELHLPLTEAKEGMVLTRDLVNADGILLLTKGHRLTKPLIDRLRALEKGRLLMVHARGGS